MDGPTAAHGLYISTYQLAVNSADIVYDANPVLDGGGIRLGGHSPNIHLVYVMVSLTGYPILDVDGFGLGGPLPDIDLV